MPCHWMPKTCKAAPFTHRVVFIFYELVNDAIPSFHFRVCLPRPGLTSFDVDHSEKEDSHAGCTLGLPQD